MSRIIAWDIETAPLDRTTFTERQQRRHQLLVNTELDKHEGLGYDEASRKVCSLHPMLGFICCISVAVADEETGEVESLSSYVADSLETERQLLIDFRDAVSPHRGFDVWVTFNGKRFDLDWLLHRCLYHGVRAPANGRMMNRNPYQNREHADLACVLKSPAGLADLCDHLGIDSPKQAMDGSGVAQAVAEGRLDDVAKYCEADVLATLNCYLAMRRFAAPAFA